MFTNRIDQCEILHLTYVYCVSQILIKYLFIHHMLHHKVPQPPPPSQQSKSFNLILFKCMLSKERSLGHIDNPKVSILNIYNRMFHGGLNPRLCPRSHGNNPPRAMIVFGWVTFLALDIRCALPLMIHPTIDGISI